MTLPLASTFETYGGTKQDYSDVVDPDTDRSAVEVNAAFADVSMMTRTITRAFISVTGATGAAPTLVSHQAVWGNTLAVAPEVSWVSTGVFDVTFPATITDPLGEEVDVNLSAGWGSVSGSTLGFISVTRRSPNEFRVRTWNTSFTANDLNGVNMNLFFV